MTGNICVGLSEPLLNFMCSQVSSQLPRGLTFGEGSVEHQGQTHFLIWRLEFKKFTFTPDGNFAFAASIDVPIGARGDMAATVTGSVECREGGFQLVAESASCGHQDDAFGAWLASNYFPPIVTAWGGALAAALSLSVSPPVIPGVTVSAFNFAHVGHAILGAAAVNGPVPAPPSASPYQGSGFYMGFDGGALAAPIGPALQHAFGELIGGDDTTHFGVKAEYKFRATLSDAPSIAAANTPTLSVTVVGTAVAMYRLLLFPAVSGSDIINQSPLVGPVRLETNGARLHGMFECTDRGRQDVHLGATAVPDWASGWARDSILAELTRQLYARLNGQNVEIATLPETICRSAQSPIDYRGELHIAGAHGDYIILESELVAFHRA